MIPQNPVQNLKLSLKRQGSSFNEWDLHNAVLMALSVLVHKHDPRDYGQHKEKLLIPIAGPTSVYGVMIKTLKSFFLLF